MRTRQFGKFCGRALQPQGKAIVLGHDAPSNTIPVTKAAQLPIDDGTCKNVFAPSHERFLLISIQDPLNMTIPYYPMTPPEPSITYNITVNQIINATGHKLFAMDGSVFQANYNHPILLLANQKNYSYPYDPQWNVINFGANSSVRINMWNNNSSPHVSLEDKDAAKRIGADVSASQCISMVMRCGSYTKAQGNGTGQ